MGGMGKKPIFDHPLNFHEEDEENREGSIFPNHTFPLAFGRPISHFNSANSKIVQLVLRYDHLPKLAYPYIA